MLRALQQWCGAPVDPELIPALADRLQGPSNLGPAAGLKEYAALCRWGVVGVVSWDPGTLGSCGPGILILDSCGLEIWDIWGSW